jgi:hypothetical protein
VAVCPLVSFAGGHSEAQLLVHVTFSCLSGMKMYRVLPWAFTSTDPSPDNVFVEICTPVAVLARAAGLAVLVAGAGVVELDVVLVEPVVPEELPQPASASRPTARVNAENRGMRVLARRCALRLTVGPSIDWVPSRL